MFVFSFIQFLPVEVTVLNEHHRDMTYDTTDWVTLERSYFIRCMPYTWSHSELLTLCIHYV